MPVSRIFKRDRLVQVSDGSITAAGLPAALEFEYESGQLAMPNIE